MEIEFRDVICMEESSITVRDYRRRTTVPSKVFVHMKLSNKDKLRWIVLRSGKVIIEKM